MAVVEYQKLRHAVERQLRRAGATADGAVLQAELLCEAEARGLPSHGVQRLPRLLRRIDNGVCVPAAVGRHEWRSTAWLDVDGELGLGPVVASEALQAAVDSAVTLGITLVSVRRSGHLGMLAWYGEWATARGLTLVALTTSEALVHPWGGTEALVGSNPISVAVPAEPDPFVSDLATAVVSMGKIHSYAARSAPIPATWARDASGAMTTDAAAAMHGAIAPFGEAKGYALGLGFELLVAGLTGTSYGRAVHGTLDDDLPSSKGDVFLLFGGRSGDPSEYLRELRSSLPARAGEPVRIPGDRARAVRARSLRDGISLPDALWLTISTGDGRQW